MAPNIGSETDSQDSVDFFDIPKIPEFLHKDVKEKLAFVANFVEKVSILDNGRKVSILTGSSLNKREKERLNQDVTRVVKKIVDGAFEPRIRLLENYLDRPVIFNSDPTSELIDAGELIQEGNGYHILGSKLSLLIDYVESCFLKLAQNMRAQPYRFPSLIPAEYMEKVKYFTNFPHSLSFVSHLEEDLKIIENFSNTACCNNGTIEMPRQSLAPPKVMLSPTVCHHLFYALAGKQIPKKGMTVTAYGNCFRYESSNMVSLERLWNFTMREIIFVGEEIFVKKGLDSVRGELRKVFSDLGLAYKIETASDPFFIGNFKNQTAYQNALELKFEVRALLPFKGDTLAIGSFNRHQDFFGSQLDIRMSDGNVPQTGCIGLGYERLAFAFVSQHSLDVENWPEKVRNYMKSKANTL